MSAEIAAVITFLLSNFSLTFLVIGILFALTGMAFHAKPVPPANVTELFLRWYLFWAIGVTSLYNAVMHIAFGPMAAAFIGWPDSPFQAEVGFASAGFGVVALVAIWGSLGMRFLAVLGPAIFLWGDAYGHIRQMMLTGDFAPGNAGVVFWTDILVPVLGFLLILLQYHQGKPVRG